MDSLYVFVRLGWDHILDLSATDHLLYLSMLAIRFVFADLKALLFRVSAFALGHAATTAISGLTGWTDSSGWVEFSIAASIALTALFNLPPAKKKTAFWEPQTALALFFGLVHGLGFGSYFSQLTASGSSLGISLLGFTLGIEFAQFALVFAWLGLWAIFESAFGWKHREWVLALSGAGCAWSIGWCIEKWPL